MHLSPPLQIQRWLHYILPSVKLGRFPCDISRIQAVAAICPSMLFSINNFDLASVVTTGNMIALVTQGDGLRIDLKIFSWLRILRIISLYYSFTHLGVIPTRLYLPLTSGLRTLLLCMISFSPELCKPRTNKKFSRLTPSPILNLFAFISTSQPCPRPSPGRRRKTPLSSSRPLVHQRPMDQSKTAV